MVDSVGGPNTPRPTSGAAGAAKTGRAARAARAGNAPRTDTDSGDDLITFTSEIGDTTVPVLALPKKMDADVMMTLLYAIQQKQGQDQIKTSEARIDDKKIERQKKHDEIMHKIHQMHKAKKKGGVGAKVGMAFGWIGVGLAWIAVGVVGVVSGGAAAVPLAVAATAMTALMICQQTGATEKAIDAMNLDSKGAMGVQIGMAAAMLVINIGAMIMSGGAAAGGVVAGVADVAEAGTEAGVAASEVATTTAEAGTQAGVAASEAATAGVETGTEGAVAGSETATASVEAGTDTAETTASATEETSNTADTASQAAGKSGRLVRAANRVRSAAQIAQATTQAGGGAAEITTAKYNYEAAQDRADAQDDRADLAKAQEITLEELRRIRKLIEEMQNASTIVIGTIDETQETAMNIRRTI